MKKVHLHDRSKLEGSQKWDVALMRVTRSVNSLIHHSKVEGRDEQTPRMQHQNPVCFIFIVVIIIIFFFFFFFFFIIIVIILCFFFCFSCKVITLSSLAYHITSHFQFLSIHHTSLLSFIIHITSHFYFIIVIIIIPYLLRSRSPTISTLYSSSPSPS